MGSVHLPASLGAGGGSPPQPGESARGEGPHGARRHPEPCSGSHPAKTNARRGVTAAPGQSELERGTPASRVLRGFPRFARFSRNGAISGCIFAGPLPTPAAAAGFPGSPSSSKGPASEDDNKERRALPSLNGTYTQAWASRGGRRWNYTRTKAFWLTRPQRQPG